MELLAIWLAIAVFTAIIASSKGRSGFGWFILGLLFSLIALIAAAAVPNRKPALADWESKKCPHCAETVRSEAKVCRFCGFNFVTNEPAGSAYS